jgi:hypothetical protein
MRKFFSLAVATTIVVSGVAVFAQSPARAETVTLIAYMDAASEVPPNVSEGTGTVVVNYDTGSKLLSWNGSFSGLTGNMTAAHFYGPAGPGKNAGVAVPMPNPTASFVGSAKLTDAQAADLLAGRYYAKVHTETHLGDEVRPTASFEGSATLTDAQAAELLAGRYYAKVHTASNPGGEIRGQLIRFDQLWLSH